MRWAIRVVSVPSVDGLAGVTGCGKSEPAAPPVVVSKDKPAPPKIEPDPVKPVPKVEPPPKVEFDIAVDPRMVITSSGSEYSAKDLEQPQPHQGDRCLSWRTQADADASGSGASTAVTEAGIAQLKDHRGLPYIWLQGTKVSDAGVAEFKKTHPKCEVIN